MTAEDWRMIWIAAACVAAAVVFLLRRRLRPRWRSSDWQLRCRSCGETRALVTISRRLPVGRIGALRPIGRRDRYSRRLFLHWCEHCGWWRFGVARPDAHGPTRSA